MGLAQVVARLRDAGEIVVQLLPGESAGHDEFEFDRHLVFENNQWIVQVRDDHQKL
jgi:ATP phosphoribosyltransferase regulatory subunit